VRVLAGTSGYSYAPWKGVFYPEKLPAAKMLGYYAGRLPTVEINNTFYRMPNAELVGRWAQEVPEGFSFALKAPRRITHERRLADADEAVKQLFATAAALGGKLGPVLFQLPPFLRKDVGRLESFLATLRALAPDARAAFEFRHESWFDEEVFTALRNQNAALVISESEKIEAPLVATADWGYLRLRREDYVDADLARWANHLKSQPWQHAFVYFKHEDAGIGPKLAAKFTSLVGDGIK
jgi:uncharacterized protein YecE (DUF72 family)